MEYNGMAVLSAWKKFVNENILDATHLRAEIARSWLRCKDQNLDPWSADFDKTDEKELSLRRDKYHKLVKAAEPVLQYLVALFNCNASLSDLDGFVFELLTPLSVYSRTLGTYVVEPRTGTGNLPLALLEKKPIRVDGFEHYRAVSQNYSGVSAPIRLSGPISGAVLNINDPFIALPPEALDIAITAARLVERLCAPRREVFVSLSSASFFDGILRLRDRAVIVVDQDGMLLTCNPPARQAVSGFEMYPYAERSLGEYLENRQELFSLLTEAGAGEAKRVGFRPGKQRRKMVLRLLRSRTVQLQNGLTHHVMVFENPDAETRAPEETVLRRREDAEVDYIGTSPLWREVDAMVRKIAGHRSNVLLLGATGTGKEVVARAIHRLSGRKGEFVAINCGAIPRDLLASELFGYEGGAFTGARMSGAVGKFEYANGGTLFLDEIGEMPVDMQVTLLRVLQEQTITRIGSNMSMRFDVRIIAATNQNIEQLIEEKRFRADLRYRLSVIEIQLPLLRDRGEDVPLLARYFNDSLGESLCIPTAPLSPEAEEFLCRYAWPGNVRELKNVMEKALIMANGKPITVGDFPGYMQEASAPKKPFRIPQPEHPEKPSPVTQPPAETIPLTPKQQQALREKQQISALIEKNCGNLSKVAKDMGISRNTLYRKIHGLGIEIQVSARQKPEP